jgi:Carboxypeptidase regulatory-like domain/HEAT repeats
VTLLSKPVPTRTQIGDPKRRCGAGYRPLPTLCLGVASFVALTCGFQANGVAEPIQQLKGNAVIVGTVVDENHVPVARAQVQAFSAEDVQRAPRGSQRLARSAGSTSTDGTGSFQISGLAAGDYIVAAEAIPTFPNGGPPPARVYGPTFYPSTLDFSQAVVVNALDHQPPTVQIELVPVKPVRVTGTIISASGGSTEGFDVRLFRRFGGFGSGATLAAVREKGKFEIPRVPPGSYELTVEPHASRFGQESREFVDTMIDVKDHDVDLSLTVGRGASLTGHVVVEPAGAATTPIGLRVTANKAHEQFAGGSAIATAVNADWSFRMTGLSGSYEFLVSSDRPPPVVAATRIVVDGTSYATAAGITLAEGDHDVVVFVAPRDAPKPTVDSTQNSSALVQQFKNEKVLWKQIEIGKVITGKHDASVLSPLADWLGHPDRHIRGNVAFIFASFDDPRGLQTIADILADRSERPEGQGVPTAPSDGRYRVERQVASDRYYAAHLLGDLRDPRGIALLVPLLDDPEAQSIVPWSLGQIGDKRAIPPLIAALDNDDPSNRVLVIYALEALDAKEAVPRLMTLVNDDRKSRFGALVTVSEAAKAAIAKLR